jgi:hypothetical protein
MPVTYSLVYVFGFEDPQDGLHSADVTEIASLLSGKSNNVYLVWP